MPWHCSGCELGCTVEWEKNANPTTCLTGDGRPVRFVWQAPDLPPEVLEAIDAMGQGMRYIDKMRVHMPATPCAQRLSDRAKTIRAGLATATINLQDAFFDTDGAPDCHQFFRCPKSTACRFWQDGIGCTDRRPDND